MSRSVMMPGPAPSGSITMAAPTRRLAICCAACRNVCPGPTVSTTSLIPSRTCTAIPPSGSLATFVAIVTHRPSTIRLRAMLLREANAIVDREYASDLALDDVARRVASSRRQLQRAYAEIGKTTFRDHLTRVRMDRAAEMLASRALTVREVARRVGYRQPAQFAKAFRRYQGLAPSAFRSDRRDLARA